ncbi:MAG: hypothetical protein RLZZ299_1899 [Pseudomonadota bacterium]|jgi:predicted aminopeptidase
MYRATKQAPPSRPRTRAWRLAALALAGLLGSGCQAGYLLRAGWYQAEMLASREPLDAVLEGGRLPPREAERLRLVPALKAHGRALGLAATENYDSVAVGWNRTIWNVSACAPLSFEVTTTWFPIVGRVPYLGFFREDQARAQAKAWEARGLDVHVRTAGAYSTLGWFRDPVLPSMLRGSDTDLANTVFHELAHATTWIPGSVSFNETFASFVGEAATRDWLVTTWGPHAAQVVAWDRERRDMARIEALLHGLYTDLDAVYRDPARSPVSKREAKAALYASLPTRVAASDIEDQTAARDWAARGPWNNARLAQFRTYNGDKDLFAALYAREGGNLPRFLAAVRTLSDQDGDPAVALRRAAGPTRAASTSADNVKIP